MLDLNSASYMTVRCKTKAAGEVRRNLNESLFVVLPVHLAQPHMKHLSSFSFFFYIKAMLAC